MHFKIVLNVKIRISFSHYNEFLVKTVLFEELKS